MAHDAQRLFFENVKEFFPEYFSNVNVLEVGSLDINGSVRDFFDAKTYLGIDVGPGPGVDLAIQGQDLSLPDHTFDVSVSAECFEHNPHWKETFINMVRMTKPDGIVLFTCAGYDRPEHGTVNSDIGSSPLTVDLGWEYYKNLGPEDFESEINLSECFGDYAFFDNRINLDLYFVGLIDSDHSSALKSLDEKMSDWLC